MSASIRTFALDSVDFDKGGGLVPAIVQHAASGAILMLGYVDRDALAATLDSGNMTFHSRSRGKRWVKGESSGHYLKVIALAADCDGDALLALAEPIGPTCHRGSESCFDAVADDGAVSDGPRPSFAFLAALDTLIAARERERPAGSYTTALFASGVTRIAQKVGEEGVETALAAATGERDALVGEAGDLIFHLLVLLRARGAGLADVVSLLRERHGARQ